MIKPSKRTSPLPTLNEKFPIDDERLLTAGHMYGWWAVGSCYGLRRILQELVATRDLFSVKNIGTWLPSEHISTDLTIGISS